MATFSTNKPNTKEYNKALKEDLEVLKQEIKELTTESKCEHEWESAWEDDYDGHRTDRYQVWICKKPKCRARVG